MALIPDSDFGKRVRARLGDERVVWLTTTSANGTPQPNPVWFYWDGAADEALVYNATNAARLDHIAVRPRVSLNFDGDGNGGDIVVIAGVAEQALDVPPVDENAAYLAKYADSIAGVGSDPAQFARDYSVPMRIRFVKVRGF